LVASSDEVLLELLALFAVEHALKEQDWSINLPGIVGGTGAVIRGVRGQQAIEVYYQRVPMKLSQASRYGEVQRIHEFDAIGGLRPDLIFRIESPSGTRWLVVEVKGIQREAKDSAREALQNLLAYRRAFDPVLAEQSGTYGLGIAWGEDLTPRPNSE